jgi:formylglycine-generating enzyme required for sulfatase activity
MKKRFSKLVGFLCMSCLADCALAPAASAQLQPSLDLQFSAGQPTLILTGGTGTVCSIQYATDLSETNQWVHRTLLQVQAVSNLWTDPLAPSLGQRFYRAVSVAAPADTNLVFIQPGTFTMGSPTNEVDRFYDEGPQTTVTISRGFWIGRYLVTQGDYISVVGSNPSYFQGDTTLPVEQVSWYDALNYCALRTQKEGAAGLIPTNYAYRLPTEAEWEYACRAGTTTRFYYGDDPGYSNLMNYAWYADNSGGMTQPVGQVLPNPWGLYDMNGNVWEWCQDWYGPYPGGIALDPQGPLFGSSRAIRGGSWDFNSTNCRSATRNYRYPNYRFYNRGFRVLLVDPRQG